MAREQNRKRRATGAGRTASSKTRGAGGAGNACNARGTRSARATGNARSGRARRGAGDARRTKAGAQRGAKTAARRAARPKKTSGTALALQRKKRTVRLVAIILAVVVVLAAAWRIGTWQVFDAKYDACEKWRTEAAQACTDCGLGGQWTDTVLAVMVVESSGDLEVDSVLGVENDVMQAAEGAWGWIVTDGWPEHGVQAETPQASIYAGVLEFKQNLELWDSYLEGITPEEPAKIQLVVQGYNFGADGWFQWCEDNGVRAYSVDAAREYSDEKMPAEAKGTPTHAAKWLEAYERICSDRQDIESR